MSVQGNLIFFRSANTDGRLVVRPSRCGRASAEIFITADVRRQYRTNGPGNWSYAGFPFERVARNVRAIKVIAALDLLAIGSSSLRKVPAADMRI